VHQNCSKQQEHHERKRKLSNRFGTSLKITCTGAPISSKSILTSAVMSANSVGAVCIHVTVMASSDAFINIYKTRVIKNWSMLKVRISSYG